MTTAATSSLPQRHYSRHKLTKQAPVQLNVTPPPPDRSNVILDFGCDSGSLSSMMLHRVSDRRTMYAMSKLSFKRLPVSRPSQEASVALESLDGSGEARHSRFHTNNEAQNKNQLQKPASSDTEPTNTNTLVTRIAPCSSMLNYNNISTTSNRLLPESSGLLDPMQIPARVRNSLLDMHYHLHQKPGLLQTSRISKSDSNIKVPPGNVFLHESKKLLSLQKSTCD